MGTPGLPPSQTPIKDQETAEIFQDINFMRDLGPLSRKLALVTRANKDAPGYKEVRQLQKKILDHFIEVDST